MHSMTGYGKSVYNNGGISLSVEVKTVNNRYLDVVPKYPRIFMKYDDLMRNVIASYLSRGRVELMILLKVTEAASKPVVLDSTLAKSYYDAFKNLSAQYPELGGELNIYQLMRFPDVVTEALEEDDDTYKQILTDTLKAALISLNDMRLIEGEKLKADLAARITEVENIVCEIEKRAPLVKEAYKEKLKARVEEYLGGIKMDEARLLQEVALFADKSNIDEELTRLKSHISQFRQIINTENCGKRLDFLVQELNRESNTICSKSNDIIVTDCGLKLKCEIEKIREQIQNIE